MTTGPGDSPEVVSAEQALINALLIEVAASRSYYNSMDPKPGPQHLQRGWLSAALDTALAQGDLRCALDKA